MILLSCLSLYQELFYFHKLYDNKLLAGETVPAVLSLKSLLLRLNGLKDPEFPLRLFLGFFSYISSSEIRRFKSFVPSVLLFLT